ARSRRPRRRVLSARAHHRRPARRRTVAARHRRVRHHRRLRRSRAPHARRCVPQPHRAQPARRRRRPQHRHHRPRPTEDRSMSVLTDTSTVFNRELRPVLRDPFSVIFSMIQLLIFLGLFAPLLPDAGADGSALQWFVPGIVVMSCVFSTSFTGSNLLFEIQTGAHERMLVTPLSRPALIIGRALKEAVPLVIQTAIIVGACVPFGFDVHLGGATLGLLMLAIMAVGLGALSYTLALASKNTEWLFWTVQQTVLFPLLLL